MAEKFREQGGAATMDPSRLLRWLTSKLMNYVSSPQRLQKKRIAIEKQRIRKGAPHRVEYFHQVEDGYSHLAAQMLKPLLERYEIELVCHLVDGPRNDNAAEPELLLNLSRYDALYVAPEYGLEFPQSYTVPTPALVRQAAAILAAQDSDTFSQCAASVGAALWSADSAALQVLTEHWGAASSAETINAIEAGTKHREALKHYSGAMFYYAGEWYWGVDRLYHLEKRLAALGADRNRGEPPLVPRPAMAVGDRRDNGSLTLEVYASLRSPYTAIIFDRAVELARETGVRLEVRPVLPMVMRGVPATREKGMYIFTDAAREAREGGLPYGNFYDPIGEPARRCYSLYPWAVEQGKGVALMSSFLRAAFSQGINTNTDSGLKSVVENAGLDWDQAKMRVGDRGWEALLEQNRLAMYEAGLWGVPTFRLLDEGGKQLLGLWGQDRLWLIAREIQRYLNNGTVADKD